MSEPIDVANRWTQAVNNYCERTGPEFWSEPLNAVTNAAFLLGAAATWWLAGRQGRRGDWGVIALVGLQVAIGIGSFLFHTLATRWGGLADVIPIQLFILVYLHLATVRLLGAPVWAGAAAAAAFVPASVVAAMGIAALVGPLNGSVGYVPTMLLLFAYAGALALRGHPAARGLAVGGALLAVSLVWRTLDDQSGAVCAAFPLGTHWLWHLTNGVLLAWVAGVMVRHGAPLAPRARAG